MTHPALIRLVVCNADKADNAALLELITQCARLARAGGPRYDRWAVTCIALIREAKRRCGQDLAPLARTLGNSAPENQYTLDDASLIDLRDF